MSRHTPRKPPIEWQTTYLEWDEDRRMSRRTRSIGWLAGLGWTLFTLVDIALGVGIVLVAVHFVSKYW